MCSKLWRGCVRWLGRGSVLTVGDGGGELVSGWMVGEYLWTSFGFGVGVGVLST